MILSRVVEHAKTQNWFAVTLDFFIVVLGVFVGIEVANWNQARRDRQEERRYYGQLLVDLRGDLQVFSRAERRADLYDAAAQLVIDRLGGKAPPRVSPGQMAMAIHKAGWVYIPYASRGTYNELVSTGNLGLLRSSELKSEIANYYASFDEGRQWDSLLRDQQSDYWRETAGVLPRSVVRAALRGTEPTLSPGEDRAIWQAARSHPRLSNMLIGMGAHQERIRRDSESEAARAKQLIADIEQHLKDSGIVLSGYVLTFLSPGGLLLCLLWVEPCRGKFGWKLPRGTRSERRRRGAVLKRSNQGVRNV
jgi:hypothetical protein